MSRTVLVTPFGKVGQLAAACALNDIRGYAVPVGPFSAVVFDDLNVEEAGRSAAALSKLTGKHEILLLARSDEQIDAGHYRNGERESDVPAGLALSNLPDTVEKLLLEVQDPQDIDGSINAAEMSKVQASQAAMTPERMALAKNALLWMLVALLALAATVVGVFAASAQGSFMLWAATVLGAAVFAFSVFRIYRLLVKPA